MKASDIPDDRIYEEVQRLTVENRMSSAMLFDVQNALAPEFSAKIVFAKVCQMINKGRLRGCNCGCRGDLRFPWVDFGEKANTEGWKERMPGYLKGKRTYGY